MASFDITGQGSLRGLPEYSLNGHFRLPIVIDFSTVNDGAVVAAAEEVTFWNGPAEIRITQMIIKCEKVEGATLTVDVGDTDDTNGWFDDYDGNVLASAESGIITAGEYYATEAAAVFKIVPNNDADVAIFTVVLLGVDAGFRLNDPLT